MGDPQLLMQIHDELIYEVRIRNNNNYNNNSPMGSAGILSDIGMHTVQGPQSGLSSEFKNMLQKCMGIEVRYIKE